MLLLMRRIGESLRISEHLLITIKDIKDQAVTFTIGKVDGTMIEEFSVNAIESV